MQTKVENEPNSSNLNPKSQKESLTWETFDAIVTF